MNARNDTTPLDGGYYHEETRYSDSTGALAAALAKAQCEMQNPTFDRQNPHYRSKFASLASVRNAVIPVLAKYGIACVQDLRTTEKGVSCTTVLLHASGQSCSYGPYEVPATKQDAQGFGSAATYARRYHLMAVAGVVGDDDDDANAAVGEPAAAEKPVKIDTKLANKWAKAIIDQQDEPHRLVDIWNEIKGDVDMATAVWGALPKSIKDRVKDATSGATT